MSYDPYDAYDACDACDPREPAEPTDEEIELQQYAAVGRAYMNMARAKDDGYPENNKSQLVQALHDACEPLW